MADKYRFLKGPMNTIVVPVQPNTEIEVGDFVFLDAVDNLRNNDSSTASHKAYPFDSLDAAAGHAAAAVDASDYFLGIALEAHDSDSVDDNILVGTDGDWVMDLDTTTSVKVGYSIEPYSASGVEVYDQKCKAVPIGSQANPLGWCIKEEDNATEVQFRMRSKYGLGGLIK
ncbi:MAG: hypothetical protein DRI01_01960 [Chloroflexi bacterium]|nr:MAG: hypothetical protein DRI01_01960 [Chloroflexota bacterium]